MDAANASKDSGRVVRRSLRSVGESVISGRTSPASVVVSNTRAFHRRASAPERTTASTDEDSPSSLSPFEDRELDWDPYRARTPSWAEAKSHLSMCNHRLLNPPDLKGYAPGCFALRFSPDDSQLAAGFFDGSVVIYDLSDGSQVSKWNVAQARSREGAMSQPGVTNLRWYPGGLRSDIVATVDTSGATHIWGDLGKFPRSGEFRHLAEIPGSSCLTAISFSSDGSRLMVAGTERVIQIYDVAPERASFGFSYNSTLGNGISAPGKVTRHSLKVRCLSSHPNNNDVFVSGGLDQNILVWDLRTGPDAVGLVAGTQLSGDAMEMSNDGNMLFIGSHRPNNPLQLFDLRTYKVLANYGWRGCLDGSPSHGVHMQKRPTLDTTLKSSSCSVFAANWDAESNRILAAAGEHENQARIFQKSASPSKPLKVVGTLEGEHGGFWSAAISADGRCVAFGDSSGAVHAVDVAGAML